jgi:exopolysaccharide biosynthesis polyprenyl glycosylphosphotransferase
MANKSCIPVAGPPDESRGSRARSRVPPSRPNEAVQGHERLVQRSVQQSVIGEQPPGIRRWLGAAAEHLATALRAPVAVALEPDAPFQTEADADVAARAGADRRVAQLYGRRGSLQLARVREWRYHEAAILTSDVLMLALGGAAAMAIGPSALKVTLLFAVISFAALAVSGSYRSRLRPGALDRLPAELAALCVAALATNTLGTLLFGVRHAPLAAVAASLVASAVAVTAGRIVGAGVQRTGRARGRALRPVLIVGTGEIGAQLAERLEEQPEYGLRPVGFLDADPYPLADAPRGMPPFLGGPTALAGAVEATGARHVMLAFSPLSDGGLIALIRRCQDLGVEVSVVPRFFDTMSERAVVEHVGGLPVVRLRTLPPRSWRFMVKYTLDRIVSAAALIIAAPLFAIVAVAIKLDSPGPVFFRQQRVGRDGQIFDLVKFRSMRSTPQGAEWFDLAPGAAPGGIEGDDRRTRLGSVLRRTCLDELPQLFNVARGEMSLVGPRPERPRFVELFGGQCRRYDERHRVKSGITGWAQVNGLRGRTSIAKRVEWDNYYIENWSLWLDIKILILTLLAVIRTPRDS